MAKMTPSFSKHGNKVFYSAGKEIKEEYKPFVAGTNHLYLYDLNPKISTQFTQGENDFDFYPQEIENNELVFLGFYKDKKA